MEKSVKGGFGNNVAEMPGHTFNNLGAVLVRYISARPDQRFRTRLHVTASPAQGLDLGFRQANVGHGLVFATAADHAMKKAVPAFDPASVAMV